MSRLFANSSSIAGWASAMLLSSRSSRPLRRGESREEGELGVDDADVVEAELAECVVQLGFAVVPALTGRSRPVAAATRGRERQGPAAQETAGNRRRTMRLV